MSEYPDAPGHKARETSAAAAAAAADTAPFLRARVLDTLASAGDLTADECAGLLGLSVLSIRPRFSELARKGRIRETGERRENVSGRSAAVWRLA